MIKNEAYWEGLRERFGVVLPYDSKHIIIKDAAYNPDGSRRLIWSFTPTLTFSKWCKENLHGGFGIVVGHFYPNEVPDGHAQLTKFVEFIKLVKSKQELPMMIRRPVLVFENDRDAIIFKMFWFNE